jgi:hypothetical protein
VRQPFEKLSTDADRGGIDDEIDTYLTDADRCSHKHISSDDQSVLDARPRCASTELRQPVTAPQSFSGPLTFAHQGGYAASYLVGLLDQWCPGLKAA